MLVPPSWQALKADRRRAGAAMEVDLHCIQWHCKAQY